MSEEKEQNVQAEFTEAHIIYNGRTFNRITSGTDDLVKINVGFMYEDYGFIRIIKTVEYTEMNTIDAAEFTIHGHDLEVLHAAHMMRKLGWMVIDDVPNDGELIGTGDNHAEQASEPGSVGNGEAKSTETNGGTEA